MSRIPDDLIELDQWVLWRLVARGDGKPTKVPFRINGQPASTTDPTTWDTYENVSITYESGHWDGIGFIFTQDDPFTGIDIDNCIDVKSGRLAPQAVPVLEHFPDTYTEISPSQTGLKIFSRGSIPGGKGVQFSLGGGVNVEIYSQGRYFTVTGNHWNDEYFDIEDGQTGIDWLLAQSPQSHGQRGIPYDITTPTGKIPKGFQHNTLISLAGTMRSRGISIDTIYEALAAINRNQCTEPGEDAEMRRIADSFARYKPGELHSFPQLKELQQEAEPAAEPPPPPDEPPTFSVIQPSDEPIELLSQTLTDDGNASRLLAIHGNDILYCPPMRKWLIWDSQRWVVDEANRIQELAIETSRLFLKQVEDRVSGNKDLWKFATKSLNAAAINNMVDLASSRRVIMPVFLDAQPYLLNTINGTIDLRTSTLQPHNREDFLTKLVHYEFNPAATCPTWLGFLDWTMSGAGEDESVERTQRFTSYLQRAFGYGCTGVTSEKAFFIFYGESGDNGKTTMSNMVHHVLQEYSTSINIESLMTGRQAESTNAQSDLADLRGARYVQTSEAQSHQKLDQSKLKQLAAGGGTYKACRKFENTITFPQTWKIFMDTNPLPIISDPDDQATMARLHPVPFLNKISEEDKDMTLPAKLEAESEGILAWLVEGARIWCEVGLQKPDEVMAAREAWRSDQDQFGRFVEESCVIEPDASAGAEFLYKTYKIWVDNTGEKIPMSMKEFGNRMRKVYASKRRNNGVFYIGIRPR